MSEVLCAFLRGVNVGGMSMKMDRLKQAFTEMGYPDAKTLLASGNVVFSNMQKIEQPEAEAMEDRLKSAVLHKIMDASPSDASPSVVTQVMMHGPQSDSPHEEVKRRIEKALSILFAYDAHVMVRSIAEVRKVVGEAEQLVVPEACHLYHLICDSQDVPQELTHLWESVRHAPEEQFEVHQGDMLWIVPKGSTLESEFGGKVLGAKRFKALLTSRNRNTMEKVLREMEARVG